MPVRFSSDDVQSAAVQVHKLLSAAESVVAFTGAGISTESGIPDFRSPGGVWARNRTVYFDEYCRSAEGRHEYWRQKSEAHADFAKAVPNITHTTLATWEERGLLSGIITQNIDGLHQAAGNTHVTELHGTAREVACLECSWRDRADSWVQKFLDTDVVPDCPECGAIIKHATVSFGQSLPRTAIMKAQELTQAADLVIALGSSLVVEPAASFPREAKRNGARLVIINRDETPLDSIADVVINASLGDFFPALNSL